MKTNNIYEKFINLNIFSDPCFNEYILKLRNTKIMFYPHEKAWALNEKIINIDEVINIVPQEISSIIIKNIDIFSERK